MPHPLDTDVFTAHMDGLKALLEERFSTIEDNFGKINGRLGKVETLAATTAAEVNKVKTVWATTTAIILLVWTVAGNALKKLVGLA